MNQQCNFAIYVSTKNNIEEQFWEMLEPNNYYAAIKKLEKIGKLFTLFCLLSQQQKFILILTQKSLKM